MRKIYTDPQGVKHYSMPRSLVLNGNTYCPPTEEQLTAAGWTIEEIIDPIPEPYIPTYAELVEQYIREHGYPTYGAELAIINNYADNPTEYTDAWLSYQGVRAEAKRWAEKQPHREEE